MNRNIGKIFCAAIALVSAAACSKQLDIDNPNQQTTETFWKTSDDAVKGINAAYGSLIIDGSYMRCTPLMMDTRGEDVYSSSPWDQMYNSGKFSLGTANDAIYGWAYGAYYEGVARCNQVLEYVPGITMDAALKTRILGQAYFLRGLYYYHLVNFFGNVGLRTSVPKDKTDFYIPQASAKNGWAQVINDFKKSIDMIPVTYAGVTGADAGDAGRATKGAAYAFIGKCYMMNQVYDAKPANFDSAAVYLKKVIDMNTYGLVANYRDNFIMATENNKESIFEVQFSETLGGTVDGWGGVPLSTWSRASARAITYGAPGYGFRDVQPSRFIYNEFLLEKTATNTDDPRLDATMFYNKTGGMKLYKTTFAASYASNTTNLNDLFCRKYENDDTKTVEDWKSGINDRIMRYADVLLMYAECLNEQNKTLEAYPWIQQVRSRAGLKDLAVVKPNMTKLQMSDQISHERLLEFCLEGHRYDDLRRWGWLSDPAKLAILKTRDGEFNSFKAGREVYPIPQYEIVNNPTWLQNEGYR